MFPPQFDLDLLQLGGWIPRSARAEALVRDGSFHSIDPAKDRLTHVNGQTFGTFAPRTAPPGLEITRCIRGAADVLLVTVLIGTRPVTLILEGDSTVTVARMLEATAAEDE